MLNTFHYWFVYTIIATRKGLFAVISIVEDCGAIKMNKFK